VQREFLIDGDTTTPTFQPTCHRVRLRQELDERPCIFVIFEQHERVCRTQAGVAVLFINRREWEEIEVRTRHQLVASRAFHDERLDETGLTVQVSSWWVGEQWAGRITEVGAQRTRRPTKLVIGIADYLAKSLPGVRDFRASPGDGVVNPGIVI